MKANISLLNLAEAKQAGLFLSLKKGINELLNKQPLFNRQRSVFMPESKYSPVLSVIICTLNREALASKSAFSLAQQGFDKCEIIVVNNKSTPLDKNNFPKGTILACEERLGLSHARNKGASLAKGEYLLFIDDDAVAHKDLLVNMYTAFCKKKAQIIGGQIELTLPTPVPTVFLEGKEGIWSGYTVPYKSFKIIKEHFEFPYGACFGICHSVLDYLGGFPADYGRCGENFAGGEETALCFSAQKAGFKIGIEPSCRVFHNVSADRFTKKHIKETIRAGIHTTFRLCKEGYTPYIWTNNYIKCRIDIIKEELLRLEKGSLPYFYKKCEYDAFLELAGDIYD